MPKRGAFTSRTTEASMDRTVPMHAAVATVLLSAYPRGAHILSAHAYRPGYRSYPMRVHVRTPDGNAEYCVVKLGDRIDLIEREARVLTVLGALGFPVPRVLAGPVSVPEARGRQAAMILSELPGQPLPWLGTPSLVDADLTCRLLIHGVAQLHQLTERMRRHDIAKLLPRTTLVEELTAIVQQGGPWLHVDLFVRAVEALYRRIGAVELPLVFSNGDYNPLNFLHDGTALTGYIDFEHACFEDPHAGFAKFVTLSFDAYGWGTGSKVGLVERYLYTQNISRGEFVPRLVLRCLRRLQRDVAVNGAADALQRNHMLHVLKDSLPTIERW